MQHFRDMGRWIQAEWRRRHFDERAFPELAMSALEKFPPSELATHLDVIDAWVLGEELPPNISFKDFGEPSVTVYAAERFYVEILWWMDGTTSIHQHLFSGAFHVMEGSSVHSTYRFAERERIDSQMRVGRLEFVASEILTKGDRRPIHSGTEFIHSLFHLDRPSVSVVVRTRSEAGKSPQWDYLRPHLALDPFHPEADRRRRLGQALEVLVKTDRAAYERLVDRIVAQSDLSLVYAVLEHGFMAATSPPYALHEDRLAEIHSAVRARFARTGDELIVSCRQDRLARDLGRRRHDVHDRELRLFLALLMNVPTQQALLSLIAGQFGADPLPLVQRWLRELMIVHGPGSVELLELSIDLEQPLLELGLDRVLHRMCAAMMAGARGPALQHALAEAFPPASIEPFMECVPELEARLQDSSLRPLFC